MDVTDDGRISRANVAAMASQRLGTPAAASAAAPPPSFPRQASHPASVLSPVVAPALSMGSYAVVGGGAGPTSQAGSLAAPHLLSVGPSATHQSDDEMETEEAADRYSGNVGADSQSQAGRRKHFRSIYDSSEPASTGGAARTAEEAAETEDAALLCPDTDDEAEIEAGDEEEAAAAADA